MRQDYEKIVSDIQNLPIEGKREIKALVEKYIIEERREEIRKNYRRSMKEAKRGELIFSSQLAELKKLI
jgi:hypothetical protein